MTTFVVTTSADVANGDVSENDLSLREAIELANASSGRDRITFGDGIDYVALNEALPTISDGLRLVGGGKVTLDANADGDHDPETFAQGFVNAQRGLDIDGDGISVSIQGLSITGGSVSLTGGSVSPEEQDPRNGGGGIRSSAGVELAVIDSVVIKK